MADPTLNGVEQFFRTQISRLITTIEAGDAVAITAQLEFCRGWGDGPLLAAATVADAWLNERQGAAVANGTINQPEVSGTTDLPEVSGTTDLPEVSGTINQPGQRGKSRVSHSGAPAPACSKARRRGANDAPLSLPPI